MAVHLLQGLAQLPEKFPYVFVLTEIIGMTAEELVERQSVDTVTKKKTRMLRYAR